MLARPSAAVALAVLALTGAALCTPAPAAAQGFAGEGLKDLFASPNVQRARLTVEASLTDADGLPAAAPAQGETLTLSIAAQIPDGFYLLSQTSPAGQPAEIRLTDTAGLEPAGEKYTPDHAPKSVLDPNYGGVVEKFTGEVIWTRPFTVTGDGPIRVAGELRGTYCSAGAGGMCVPLRAGDAAFDVDLSAGDSSESTDESATSEPAANDAPAAEPYKFAVTPQFRGKDGPVALNATLPAGAAIGDTIDLSVTLAIEGEYHIYALGEAGATAVPTSFDVTVEGLKPQGEFVASKPAEEVRRTDFTLREHHGVVTFTRSYEVTAADYGVDGSVTYQTCTETSCLRPKTVDFTLGEAPEADAGVVPSESESTDVPPAAAPLAETFERKESWLEQTGLWAALPLAFLGGLILNVMPCVLPVIALKAMSFAKQAGESRSRVLQLNLWYAAGVLSVFLIFACLALGLGAFMNVETFGWGDQLNSNLGKVAFTALVFALGLSMLGLYEIPVPGFVGSAAGATGHKEGALGAFLGGVLTTLLATPCTGPFLGAVGGVAVALAESNPIGSVALWLFMGLGFASPYLLIAVIPGATKLLPRPGDWMVRFKEFGGLLLLATALWLLSGVKPYELWLPILVGLFGLATGLWIVGRMIHHNDSFNRKYALRFVALAVTASVGTLAYAIAPDGGLDAVASAGEREEEGWESFDVERLNQLRNEGRTVMIEFTSGTCVNCRLNERVALDTETAHAAYEQLDVVPMKAWIDRSEDAEDWHERLNGFGVPHLAIFPAGRPNDPELYEGLLTQAKLLELLEEAAGRKFRPEGDAAPVRTAKR